MTTKIPETPAPERLEALAKMGTDRLLKEATDAELRVEFRRVGRAFTEPKREFRIGTEEANARLDEVLGQLPAYAAQAITRVRTDIERNVLTPETLASALWAIDAAARHEAHVNRLRAALEPGNGQIVEGNPRALIAKRRKSLDQRRIAINEELQARDAARRNAHIPQPKGPVT